MSAGTAGVGTDGCAPGVIHLATILGTPICLDVFAVIAQSWAHAITAAHDNLVGAFTGLTTPIVAMLTTTPDYSDRGAWGPLNVLQDDLRATANYLFGALVLLGAFWSFFPAWWRGSARDAVTIVWYAAIAAAVVNGLPVLLHTGFLLSNAFTSTVMQSSADSTALGQAFGGAFGGLKGTFGLVVFGPLMLVAATVLVIIIGVTRLVGLELLAALYALAPLAVVGLVWGPTRGAAATWLRAYVNLLLWGPFYALTIKVATVMLAGLGFGGVLQMLLGVASIVALGSAPVLVNILTGMVVKQGPNIIGRATQAGIKAATGGAAG